MFAPTPHASAWMFVTRLGEAQILLPAMLATALWLAHAKATRLTAAWLACTAVAAVSTTVTKVAFIGWGLGYAPWDFTGISGHAMFAAAILPVLTCCLASRTSHAWQTAALQSGFALALVIALSRVVTNAHSVSESVIGFGLGAAASLATFAFAPPPRGALAVPRGLVLGLALWLLAMPAGAPPSITHDLVTRLALTVSGHSRPYTRVEMLRRYRQQQALPGEPPSRVAAAG